jgi:hypothetical protein
VAGLAGCGGADNTSNAGNGNATRNGVVDTNSNMSSKPSNQSNVATVVNDNGNDNTAGVKPMNGNAGHTNANKGTGNGNH